MKQHAQNNNSTVHSPRPYCPFSLGKTVEIQPVPVSLVSGFTKGLLFLDPPRCCVFGNDPTCCVEKGTVLSEQEPNNTMTSLCFLFWLTCCCHTALNISEKQSFKVISIVLYMGLSPSFAFWMVPLMIVLLNLITRAPEANQSSAHLPCLPNSRTSHWACAAVNSTPQTPFCPRA